MVATWTAVSRVNQSKKTRRKRQEPARQKAWMEGATHRLGFVIVVTVDGRAGWSRRRPGRRRRRFCPARVGCEHKAGGAPWGSQRILPNERQRLRRRMADGGRQARAAAVANPQRQIRSNSTTRWIRPEERQRWRRRWRRRWRPSEAGALGAGSRHTTSRLPTRSRSKHSCNRNSIAATAETHAAAGALGRPA